MNNIKYRLAIIISNFILAFATVYLAFETRSLVSSDLKPHINIKDVALQSLDDYGNILKTRSWLEGELTNINSSERPIKTALLSIKFSNNGKNQGMLI